MAKDLLIEIGTEEIPARFINEAVRQLAERLSHWLQEANIDFTEIKTYSTPRRLAVIAKNVAEKQEDKIEEARGPSLKIAKDEAGNWTKAAQGFARGQGVSVDDFIIKEIKGVAYVFAKKEYKGQEVNRLLPQKIKEIITSLTFPKNMRWGDEELRFVRPIRWLLTLFGEETISLEIAGVTASSKTKGHRFLGKETVIPFPEKYEPLLEKEYVIVDPEIRKEIILRQMKELEVENGWRIPIDQGLLEEVVNIVEYPTVLFGSFKEEFLELPKEVLITTMREHQRYFPVEDPAGHLLPFFVTVRNGDKNFIEMVRKGNEKVLTARLADARFFYLEDQKLSIEEALSKLEHIVFQEGLGTIGDKVRRIKEISSHLAQFIQLDEQGLQDVQRTAGICKFDLVTNMVYEFPELQGLMGEKYARIHGEKESVTKGVFEHYLPRFSGDILPATINGQLVSMADKMDNIVGSFSVGKIPTGSQDPLGLRRQAAGIVQMLWEKNHDITLKQLFDLTIDAYESRGLLKRNREDIAKDLDDFFTLRIKNLLQEQGIRYDIIDAVLASDTDHVKSVVDKAYTLKKELEDPNFKQIVDSFTRVINIAEKADREYTNPDAYVEQEEHALYAQFQKVKTATEELQDTNQIVNLYKTLTVLIDAYFDKVMVMVEDDNLRQSRLGLLLSIANMFRKYADFSKLVFGDK